MATSLDKRMAFRLLSRILQGGISSGIIDPNGKSDDELRDAFEAYLKVAASENSQLCMSIDYGPDLLKRARKELGRSGFEFAAVFYATWVEHWANWYIRCLAARRKDVNESDIRDMVREVGLRGKLSWLISILGGKPISSIHRTAIQKISECRNGFIHYKHLSEEVDRFEALTPHLVEAIKNFEKTVKYLMEIEQVVINRRTRRKISEFLKRRLGVV